jgi:hypothetical protein
MPTGLFSFGECTACLGDREKKMYYLTGISNWQAGKRLTEGNLKA